MTTTQSDAVCKCGKRYTKHEVYFNGRVIFTASKCPACSDLDKREAEMIQSSQDLAKLETKWSTLCPSSLSDVNRNKLPNPQLLDRVMTWKFGSQGLVLAGKSRTGKTRCAWQLLKREHFAKKRVVGITSYDVAAYPSRLMTSSIESKRWLDSIVRADLSLLDDVFKSSMTERAEELLFLIVDERTSRGRPIILTMNESIKSIESRLTPDRGQPIIGRIRDFCELISI